MWRELIQYDRNPPTIFIAFDDPCFLYYPPDGTDSSVDLYMSISTPEEGPTVVTVTMERGIKWSWLDQVDRNTELLSVPGAQGAVGFVARDYVDTGSSVTGLMFARTLAGVRLARPGSIS